MLTPVARSSTCWSNAPRPGSVVSAANRKLAYDAARPMSSAIDAISRMTVASPAASSWATVPRRSATDAAT